MKAMDRICWAIFGICAALTATAAPHARVDTVQAPAWVERGGQRVPLEPGMALENRDRVLTGAEARVVMQFADGSVFKLGERSELLVNAMQHSKGRFSGGLDLKSGDLRLVSHDFREAPVKRAINVRFGDVTAAVRSEADLTGSAEEAREAVALRDGKALLSHPAGAEPVELNVPLQVFEVKRGEAPTVYSIDRFQGAVWALRTQPFYDGGTQERQGQWLLRFGVFDKETVLNYYDRLRGAGFAPRIVPVSEAGRYLYELRLVRLVTEREAHSLAARLADTLHVPFAEVVQKR